MLRRSFLAGSAAAGLSATTASAQTSRPMQTAIQQAITGAQPPVAALQDAARKIRPILAKTPL